MLDDLNFLLSRCKNSVSVTVNQHRDYYEPLTEYLENNNLIKDIEAEVLKTMIETDTIVEVRAYPDTAIGSYTSVHWDLETALREVADSIRGI